MIFSPKPVVIGHRGFGRGTVEGHAENTVASYVAAVGAGLKWVEVDVARTSDDDLVTIHNPATPDGVFVVDQTADDIAQKGVPRLSEVFDALPPGIGVNIDVKSTLEDAVVADDRTTYGLVAPVLRAELERRPIFVSSFDAAALLYLQRAASVPVGLIAWVRYPLRMAVSTAAQLDLDAVCLHWESFGPNEIEPGPVHPPPERSISVAHEAGLEVMCWCPAAEEAVRLVDAGVDAIVVNDVPGVLAALAARPPRRPTAEER